MNAMAVIPADSAALERAADPAQYVLDACERAKTWLAHALEHGDIEQIVELKSQAEAIRIYTMSKQLGKDAELSAAEIVRRAERGIGLAIRRGQQAGEIRAKGSHEFNGNQHIRGAAQAEKKTSPNGYFSGGQDQTETYAMTDGVSDDQFDAAVAAAKAEQNLSRRNVVRKVRAQNRSRKDGSVTDEATEEAEWIPAPDDRSTEAVGQRRVLIRQFGSAGYTSAQISDRIGTQAQTIREIARKSEIDIPADRAMGRGTRKTIDSNRVVRETVHALEGLAMGVQLVSLQDLDPAETEDWAASLTASIRVLNRLVKQMRETTQ